MRTNRELRRVGPLLPFKHIAGLCRCNSIRRGKTILILFRPVDLGEQIVGLGVLALLQVGIHQVIHRMDGMQRDRFTDRQLVGRCGRTSIPLDDIGPKP